MAKQSCWDYKSYLISFTQTDEFLLACSDISLCTRSKKVQFCRNIDFEKNDGLFVKLEKEWQNVILVTEGNVQIQIFVCK